MCSLAAIRSAAQAGIDLSPLERTLNKFMTTAWPAVQAAVVVAALSLYESGKPVTWQTVATVVGGAAAAALYQSAKKFWTASQDAPSSTPSVEPDVAPVAPDDSASVATYPVDTPDSPVAAPVVEDTNPAPEATPAPSSEATEVPA